MDIPRFDKDASAEAIVAAISETGCAIIERLVDPDTVRGVGDELEPYFERWGMSQSFLGNKTQRMCRVIAKSPTSHGLVAHPRVLEVVGEVLKDECYHFIIGHTEANRLHPGQVTQNIHRDDTLYPFKHPCRPLLVATIWAMTDFTSENGATFGVPGSHLWDDVRKPTEQELVAATMPAGSVFLFNASLYHGGGHNLTDEVRAGLIFIYQVGWLRPGENPILAVPPELAATLPRELQDLLCYRNHGYVGHYEFQSPRVLLEPDTEAHAATDLYDAYDHISVNKR